MPTPQYIHFVITPADGVRMYATKFLPVTNSKGCRLKWWWTNSGLEIVEPGGTRQWSYKYDSQAEELQDVLGPGFTVLRQHEATEAIEKAAKKTVYVITEQNGSGQVLWAGMAKSEPHNKAEITGGYVETWTDGALQIED